VSRISINSSPFFLNILTHHRALCNKESNSQLLIVYCIVKDPTLYSFIIMGLSAVVGRNHFFFEWLGRLACVMCSPSRMVG